MGKSAKQAVYDQFKIILLWDLVKKKHIFQILQGAASNYLMLISSGLFPDNINKVFSNMFSYNIFLQKLPSNLQVTFQVNLFKDFSFCFE